MSQTPREAHVASSYASLFLVLSKRIALRRPVELSYGLRLDAPSARFSFGPQRISAEEPSNQQIGPTGSLCLAGNNGANSTALCSGFASAPRITKDHQNITTAPDICQKVNTYAGTYVSICMHDLRIDQRKISRTGCATRILVLDGRK